MFEQVYHRVYRGEIFLCSCVWVILLLDSRCQERHFLLLDDRLTASERLCHRGCGL